MSERGNPAADGLERLFLGPSGWLRSKVHDAPQGPGGQPLPWFTYGAIEFLKRVVRPTDSVFEFGAGHSTLWWQENVERVISVEHDEAWVSSLRTRLKPNVTLKHIGIHAQTSALAEHEAAPFFALPRRTSWPYDDARIVRRGLADERFVAYAHAIVEAGVCLDFVVIDGMARRLCTYLALNHVAPDGFLILDNSNRSDYDLAYALLEAADFRQLPFWGLVPGADFMTCTSLFTRSLNRLPTASFGGNSLGLPEY